MKTARFFVLLLVLAALILPQGAAAQPDYLRLHIIADSDDVYDQCVKLQVRNALREYLAPLMEECADTDAALSRVEERLEEIAAVARRRAMDCGFSGDVRLETGVFPFPDRVYGDEVVPAGEYRALRVVLGDGKGRNWWCVIYPSLCLPEQADMDAPIEFYSRIFEWFLAIREAMNS